MDDLRNKIASIIEMNVCEVGAEGLESGEIIGAETAADQIMSLFAKRCCDICGKPADFVLCAEHERLMNMED